MRPNNHYLKIIKKVRQEYLFDRQRLKRNAGGFVGHVLYHLRHIKMFIYGLCGFDFNLTRRGRFNFRQ
jgi:hypothetical protein